MRPTLIILPPPVLDHLLRFTPVCEGLPVQAFVSELAVEAFDVRILPRASRLDEDRPAARLLKPLAYGLGNEFRPIVASDVPWHAFEQKQPVERVYDLRTYPRF